MNRKELYAKVKEYGLQDAILKKHGKNFTQCSNSDLESAVLAHQKGVAKTVKAPVKEETKKVAEPVKESTPKMKGSVESKFVKLVEILGKKRILLQSEVDAIANA